jgi:hypothetical protein
VPEGDYQVTIDFANAEKRNTNIQGLVAIRAFIEQHSPHYAAIIVSRLIAGTDRLAFFPESH